MKSTCGFARPQQSRFCFASTVSAVCINRSSAIAQSLPFRRGVIFSVARVEAAFVGLLQSSATDCRCRVVATFPIEHGKFRILPDRLHHG